MKTIVITQLVRIRNSRNEIVYVYHPGDEVEFTAKNDYYWTTAKGAVWFSEAREVVQQVEPRVVLLLDIESHAHVHDPFGLIQSFWRNQ